MKLKNFIFTVILTTLFGLGAVNIKVDAEDVTKKNISTEVVADNLQKCADNTSELAQKEQNDNFSDNELNFIRTIYKEEVMKDYKSSQKAKAKEKNKATQVVTLSTNTRNYTNAELRLLSALIYCEAQGESYAGKVAVGIVTVNRKKSSKFPNTLSGVIYQKNQYTPARSGALKKALKNSAFVCSIFGTFIRGFCSP